jgi:hypothetical protein
MGAGRKRARVGKGATALMSKTPAVNDFLASDLSTEEAW